MIPDDPREFFTGFFRDQYDASSRFPRDDTAGHAVFDVTGAGTWSFAVQDRTLHVTEGVPADTVLRIVVSRDDFDGLFVERTRRKVASTGRIPEDLLDAFMPLFVGPERQRLLGESQGSLRVELREGPSTYRLTIVAGPSTAAQPRATVRVRVDDFLALLGGRIGVPRLLLGGRLKVRGDRGFALRLAKVLG